MIVFDLECSAGHRFEGWFGSSGDFTAQQRRGLVACPQCRSADVLKAPMAPHLARKGNQGVGHGQAPASPSPPAPAHRAVASVPGRAMSPAGAAAMQALAQLQAEMLKASRWVGGSFAEDARAMHYGEQDQAAIHGEASAQQVRELLDEGIEVAPILFPPAPPRQMN